MKEAQHHPDHRRKDGSIYHVEVSAFGASIDDDNGHYNASICICQDITQRKDMEKQLKYLRTPDIAGL